MSKSKEQAGSGPVPVTRSPRLARRIKQHVIGKRQRFFAIVQPGFEATARQELTDLGVIDFLQSVEGGVEFFSRLAESYRINVASRTITRLLMRLASFSAMHFTTLRSKVSEIPWELHIPDFVAVAFHVQSRKSRLHHHEKIVDAVRKGMRDRLKLHGIEGVTCIAAGKRDAVSGSLPVFIRFDRDKCRISLDASGGLLYKRGRKSRVAEAPLRETLAAAILREAQWPHHDVLIDPMCGSGTFSIEAVEMAMGRAPNAERDFAFQQWAAYRPASFQYMIRKLSNETRFFENLSQEIYAFDIDEKAVDAARGNLIEAGLAETADAPVQTVAKADFFKPDSILSITRPLEGRNALIVLNPPYGKRLDPGQTERTYRRIGRMIREHYACSYAIIVPGLECEKVLSLPYDKKILFRNGGLRVSVIFKDNRPLP